MHESLASAPSPATSSIPIAGIDASDDELAELSQRARNRRETWLAIHRAAIALVEQRGLAETTIDQIAEQAGISRRTFFNYFAAKEEAVLGLVPVSCPESALEEFRAHPDEPFPGTIRLLIAVIRASFPRVLTFQQRRRLAQGCPALEQHLANHIQRAELLVGELLAEQLDDLESHREMPPGVSREDAARALILMAGAVMKHVALTRPDQFTEEDGAAVESSIDLFRLILKETL